MSTSAASHSDAHSSHTAATAPAAPAKKSVSFALADDVASEDPAAQLRDSLLAGSFTDSSFPAHAYSPNPSTFLAAQRGGSSSSSGVVVGSVDLATMSDQRLSADKGKQSSYSSLSNAHANDTDDDDMPPPLESTSCDDHGGHGHSHGPGANHGHSHGGGGNAASAVAASSRGRARERDSRSSSSRSSSSGSSSGSTSSPSKSPKRSPVDNCGGLKNRKKASKANKANKAARRQLSWAALMCCIFMICEVIGGFMANSLAIMTDAAHLLSDLAGFLISIFALWLATRPATSRLSFGFHRAEIIGALFSVLLIWLLTGILVYEAVLRIITPEDVNGEIMFIVALLGLLVNGGMGLILMQSGHGHSHGLGGHDHDHGHSHGPPKKKANVVNAAGGARSINASSSDDHGHSHAGGGDHGHSHGGGGDEYKTMVNDHDHDDHGHAHGGDDDEDSLGHKEPENLNVKAAFIHVLGDALQSIGVMIAAILIWHDPEWRIADPICTFLFSILVLFTTTRLIRQSIGVLMEGVPEGIDPDEVEESLLSVPGVLAVHDLHIWSLSVGKPSLSVHLYCTDDAAHVLAAANKLCATKYNIHHSTIQMERQGDDIDCNDQFIRVGVGHASIDHIAQENFEALGLVDKV